MLNLTLEVSAIKIIVTMRVFLNCCDLYENESFFLKSALKLLKKENVLKEKQNRYFSYLLCCVYTKV